MQFGGILKYPRREQVTNIMEHYSSCCKRQGGRWKGFKLLLLGINTLLGIGILELFLSLDFSSTSKWACFCFVPAVRSTVRIGCRYVVKHLQYWLVIVCITPWITDICCTVQSLSLSHEQNLVVLHASHSHTTAITHSSQNSDCCTL